MDELISKINHDAMIMEDLHDLVYQAAVTNGRLVESAWKRISDRLQDIITRLGTIDKELAYELLRLWEKTGKAGKDSRRLAAEAEDSLIPAIPRVMDKLYGSFVVNGSKWSLSRSRVGYITVSETANGRYLHSPFDPMREAGILADKLYNEDMEEIHILGCGLGYLPYQLWVKSLNTLKIIIYEEDDMLEFAYRAGVLGWIDKEYVIIDDHSNIDDMLEVFIENKQQGKECYVADWKRGEYRNSSHGTQIDYFDFNWRTELDLGQLCRINRKKNDLYKVNDGQHSLKDEWQPKSSEYAVVSSGPSLNYNIQFLRNHQDKINIIAVNSCLKRLFKEGIRPDIIAMLDPLPSLRKHLEGIEDHTDGIPLVSVKSGCWQFISAYKGPVYYIDDPEYKENYNWSCSGTVSSLALDLAYYMGADIIYLIGSDLAMPEGKNFADGLIHDVKENAYENDDIGVWVESVDGKMVQTNEVYNAYRGMLEEQIAVRPLVRVFNMSPDGAKIKGTLQYDITGKKYQD